MVQHAMEFDTDEDGKLNREELTAFAQECARHESETGGPRRHGPRGNGPRGNGPGGNGTDANGPAGGPNAIQMVQHALQFDSDKDGKLSRQEFMGFAKECAKHAARGGDGGPGGPPPDGGADER